MRSLPPELDHDVIHRETGLPNPMWQGEPGAGVFAEAGRRVLRALRRVVRWPAAKRARSADQ
ncbi:hypothetical protein VSS74_29210 [Conexibacter stalactiti]|uniref:Uncharacterized protein n=1 Tax=Conexibacter stalactiti TaxID=1940611 RepID=A0ABU4I163_9ACTN|nr:hypothetical protein [Conexibacter stalactiti]MDW5598475.1 hypothetical protein [Conexibacter stalactiti]MEC5039117.1 hypothetical protein [Conexibacter stalactiti]